jgi:hypothetical protein
MAGVHRQAFGGAGFKPAPTKKGNFIFPDFRPGGA